MTPVNLFEVPFLENPDAGSRHLDEGRHGVRGAQVRLDVSGKSMISVLPMSQKFQRKNAQTQRRKKGN